MNEETGPTPAEHVRHLLGRAVNPFEISDRTLAELDTAVMHHVELRSWRHRTSPPPAMRCSTRRHVFLLSDGRNVVLWELTHAGEDGQTTEIYADEHALHLSEQRVHQDADGVFGVVPPPDVPTGHLPAGPVGGRVPYPESGSPEHARRLLRRAENPDRPGDGTARLLATARRHQISHLPRPHAAGGPWHIWCSVYRHAFLLADGREVSLYELEHNLSGTGLLVSEVYLGQDAAEHAAQLRAREQGTGS